jgi:hypothetical protein
VTGPFTLRFQASFKPPPLGLLQFKQGQEGPVSEVMMIENQKIRPSQVIGPLGEPLTIESLPPADTTRWVVRRKAEVVAAVNGGLLSIDEVCDRYSLSVEEFASWQRAVDRSGMHGLRVTRIQYYKSLYEKQQKF